MVGKARTESIIRDSPLLLAKVVARKTVLTLPNTYTQPRVGRRELVSVHCIWPILHPDCPKYPGFIVSEQGFYHCFGCGIHGGMIRILTDWFSLSVESAVEYCLKHPDVGKALPKPLTSRVVSSLFNPLMGTPL